MAEWLNAPVLKTGGPQGLGGSNPSPSARDGVKIFCQKVSAHLPHQHVDALERAQKEGEKT